MDLNKQYDNRARVPEHPEIFERWTKAAEEWRGAARCELDIAYGDGERQKFDMFWPEKEVDPKGRIAVFIHGGYWKSLDRQFFSHMARGLNQLGIAVALPSYNLCPNVEITDIIEEMRLLCATLWRRHKRHMVIAGHSAGGHLAACMLATDWQALGFDEEMISSGFSISGLFDLRPLLGISINAELQLTEKSAVAASPLLWPMPSGKRFESWVGGDESDEFIRQSTTLEAVWRGGGVSCTHVAVPEKNHFTVIDDLADPQSAMTKTLFNLVTAK